MRKIIRRFFRKKQVIVVSDNVIKTRNVTNFSRFFKLLFYCWFIFVSLHFFLYKKIEYKKNKKIDELKSVNANLSNSMTQMSHFLSNIESYLYTLNYYDRFDTINVKQAVNRNENLLKNDYLIDIEEYKEVLPVLNSMERNVENIGALVEARVTGINNLLREASLDEEAKNIYKVSYQTVSPYRENDIIFKNSALVNKIELSSVKEDVNYLNFLESFLNLIPIYKPINNYYITSKFGTRVDPFTKASKFHKGLDFAAPYNSVIYAPADGVVEIVAVRGGFGNSIEINHGNNIVTEYAHLNKSLVNVGDVVKRGDKIAIQGSSGRSTGQHLHWEVKVNKKNVDPNKFIKIGERIY